MLPYERAVELNRGCQKTRLRFDAGRDSTRSPFVFYDLYGRPQQHVRPGESAAPGVGVPPPMTPKTVVRERGERNGLDGLDVGGGKFFSANGTLGFVRCLSTAGVR